MAACTGYFNNKIMGLSWQFSVQGKVAIPSLTARIDSIPHSI